MGVNQKERLIAGAGRHRRKQTVCVANFDLMTATQIDTDRQTKWALC